MIALVRSCAVELLVVEGADDPAAPARTKVHPSEDGLDAAVPKLRSGSLDMVFVRYEAHAWMHYRSVCFSDGRAWRVSEDTRLRVEALVAACPVCRALLQGEVDTARMLLVSLLASEPAALR